MARPDKVCVGIVVAPHGVQGEVRIKTFTADPAGLAAYGAVSSEDGTRRFKVKVEGIVRGAVVARLSGVAGRDEAEAIRGLRLYVPRSALPDTDRNEYYHADLVGLSVETQDGARLGTVRAVENFGAGDLLDVETGDGRDGMLPFTGAVVLAVDLAGGRIVADPPFGWLEDKAEPKPKAARAKSGKRKRAAGTPGDAGA